MFADYHVHTEFSDDSVYPMEDVIRDALQMGMDEICITDHVDYGVKEDWDSDPLPGRRAPCKCRLPGVYGKDLYSERAV